MQKFYWEVTVQCSRCGERRSVDQPGAIPDGWIGVMVRERLPAIATSPTAAVREEARYDMRPYPVCGYGCGAKLLIAKALDQVRTKIERVALVTELREALEDGEPKPKPN